LIRVDTARFESAPTKVHWAVPREVMRRFPGRIPTVKLPASLRLRQDTVDLVGPSFYPDLPFVSGADEEERRLGFGALGIGTAVDQALDLLSSGKSIVALTLPALPLPIGDGLDPDVAALEADVIARLLERGAFTGGDRAITPGLIGCIDAHVASGAAVRQRLRRIGISTDELMVDTPEIWQGGERPIMVVKHPLSGLTTLSAFSLDPGRWCVMLSRHQVACVIVTRDGVGDALASHQHDCAARPMGAANPEWLGWQAHHRLWSEMEQQGRVIRIPA
jgi:hypothetical protein